jgi:hypothetical protein
MKTCSTGFGQKFATVKTFTIKKEIVKIVADANL